MRFRLTALFIAILLIVSIMAGCGEEQTQPAETQETATVPATADQKATPEEILPTSVKSTEPAVKETEAPAQITAPDSFIELTGIVGTSPEELAESGCSQVMTVRSEGSSASIGFYQLKNGTDWIEKEDMQCSGYVGRNGVVSYDEMQEGGYATPAGIWHISDAFYIDDKPATGLNSFKITEDTYWVDDPSSEYYNQRVVGTENMDWDSAEDMYYIRPQYNYGFVFDYNAECIPGKGSAFFFHIASNPTAGCVGTSEGNVLAYLEQLSADANPYIIIV